MEQQNKVCPQCGSKKVIPIVYGDLEPYGESYFTCKVCHWIGKGIIFDKHPYQWLLKLRIILEGFGTGSFLELEMDLIKEKIIWQKRESYYSETEKVEKKLLPPEIKRIEAGLMKCDILTWERNYDHFICLDGTSWSIKMEFGLEREIVRKSGCNQYPPQWKSFCKTLENAMGKPIQL